MTGYRLLVGIKTWCGEDWIEWALKSVYEVASQIVVVQGPVEAVEVLKGDRTLEKVKKFPDPEKKILLVARPVWPSIVAMVQETLRGKGDFYLKLDDDEVPSKDWLDEFLDLVPQAIQKRLAITSNYFHFAKDFRHVIKAKEVDEFRLRGFPIDQPVNFFHPDFVYPFFPSISAFSLRMQHRLHHYHYVQPISQLARRWAYQMVHWKRGAWADVFKMKRMDNSLENGRISAWPVEEFQGQHPEIVKSHPFWPDGVDWGDGRIGWEELVEDKEFYEKYQHS